MRFSNWYVALCLTVLLLAMSTLAKAEERTVFDKALSKYKYKTGQVDKKHRHKSKKRHKHIRRPIVINVGYANHIHNGCHGYGYNRYNRVRCNWYGCR